MSADSLSAPPLRRDRPLSFSRLGASGRFTAFELSRPVAWAIVALLAVASLALRLRGLHTTLWVDEGISTGIASHPLSQIPHLLRQDGSPPLYYVLLHLWMSWQGHSVVALHTFSLLFSLLAVPVAYWAGMSVFNRRVGLIASALAAGLPYLSQYAEETRMYSIVTVLSLLVAATFVHAFVLRRRRYVPAFALSLVVTLYTHNWSLFLSAITVVGVAFCVWRAAPEERRALLIDAAIAYAIVIVVFAPWLPTLVYQARHTGAPWALPPIIWSLTQGLYSLVGSRAGAVAILFGAGGGLLALRGRAAGERQTMTAVLVLLGLGFGTLLLAWAYAKVTPAWATRYLAVIVGPLLLATAVGFSRAGRVGVVAAVLLAAFWVLDPVGSSPSHKSNVAAVAHALSPHLGTDPLVLATQPEQVPVIHYYLPQVRRFGTPLGRTPDPGLVDWRNALPRLRRASVRETLMPLLSQVQPRQRVLLVVTTNLLKAPAWIALINHDTKAWAEALRHDRRFRVLADTAPHAGAAGIAVRGLLFERVG